jgi:hypothetical protein
MTRWGEAMLVRLQEEKRLQEKTHGQRFIFEEGEGV